MLNTTTLRPGLLVCLKTTVSGNVNYQKNDLEPDHTTEDGMRRARWETLRTIEDPVEHKRAIETRSKCRSLIVGVCSQSTFGLLCPESKAPELDEAIEQARRLADEFNTTSGLTKIGVYTITGRIAPDDVEAVRAINSEVRDLLADMETGLRKLDVRAIREAASKAKSVGAILSPEAQARVQDAIRVARSAARRIVKAGEVGAAEIDEAAIRKMTESRTAFLDLDEAKEIVVPEAEGRAIDLEPMMEIVRSYTNVDRGGSYTGPDYTNGDAEPPEAKVIPAVTPATPDIEF